MKRDLLYPLLLLAFLFSPFPFFAKEFSKTTTVESDRAEYDGNKVVLNRNVVIHNAMGRATCEKAVLIRDENELTAIDFPWLELSEKVEVTLSNQSVLNCEKVAFDYTTMTSDFFGAPEIYYVDEIGELYAQSIHVDYQEQEGAIKPCKVILRGNVKMINRSKEHTKKGEALQYALADYVEYYPSEKLVVLKGEENRQVLFFDKAKGIELAAELVKAQREGENGKEMVQGFGNVSFTFKEEQLQKLKDRFKL